MDRDALTKLLWRIDPMGTCCAVNEGMEDEYTGEARDIARRLELGHGPCVAITEVFDHWFWEGCLEEGRRGVCLEQVLAELKHLRSKTTSLQAQRSRPGGKRYSE